MFKIGNGMSVLDKRVQETKNTLETEQAGLDKTVSKFDQATKDLEGAKRTLGDKRIDHDAGAENADKSILGARKRVEKLGREVEELQLARSAHASRVNAAHAAYAGALSELAKAKLSQVAGERHKRMLNILDLLRQLREEISSLFEMDKQISALTGPKNSISFFGASNWHDWLKKALASSKLSGRTDDPIPLGSAEAVPVEELIRRLEVQRDDPKNYDLAVEKAFRSIDFEPDYRVSTAAE